jgi:hypothetical protein
MAFFFVNLFPRFGPLDFLALFLFAASFAALTCFLISTVISFALSAAILVAGERLSDLSNFGDQCGREKSLYADEQPR